MALFWSYVPEPDEFEVLVRVGAPPDLAGDALRDRQAALGWGYFELQAYCSRNPDNDRYLSRAEAMECVGPGGAWILDALCTPLPGRPPLLHTPGGPGTMCSIEGCLEPCLDEGCDCSVGMWREGTWRGRAGDKTDFRVCLTR